MIDNKIYSHIDKSNLMVSVAFSFFSSTTLAYTWVVLTFVCPNILLTV